MEDSIRNVARRFKEDGYAVVRDVLDEETVEEARRHIDWLIERNPEIDPQNPTDFGPASLLPFQASLVSDERIVELPEQVFGDDVVHLQSAYFTKTPSDGPSKTKWHQDGAYWTDLIRPVKVFSVWVALDEVTPENGCLRFIPGSHREGYIDHDISGVVDKGEDDSEVDLEANGFSEADAVDITLSPGDVSIHRPSLLHASYPNTSDAWRRACAIRYTTTDVELLRPGQEGQKETFLLRGEPGANQKYCHLPMYDPEDDSQMQFSGWESYNERASALNEKVPDGKRIALADA
jgi:phytanoyl-CoA hydroxylase